MINMGRPAEALIPTTKAAELLPKDAEAHYNLAIVLQGLGHLSGARASCLHAIVINPDWADVYNGLANAYRDHGQLEDAVASCQRAIKIKQDCAEAHSNLAAALNDLGLFGGSVASSRRALVISPLSTIAHNNLGNALRNLGRFGSALASCQRAIQINPNYANAHFNLGNVQRDLGRLDDAAASYQQAVRSRSDFAVAHNNLGVVLHDLGRLDDAVASCQRAIVISPDLAETHNSLGNSLQSLGRLAEAMSSYLRALEIRPGFVEAHCNLANVQRSLGQLDDAITSCQRALEVNPDFAEAHSNLGFILLLKGNFEEGLKRSESRFDPKGKKRLVIPPKVTFPQWQGESIARKSLLVWHEQGMGDQIQLCRYLPILKSLGAERITLVCATSLKSLFQRLDGADKLLTVAELGDIPTHDYWTFPLSLPLHCCTTPSNIPAAIPYLYADEKLQHDISTHLTNIPEFKVGICWQGAKGYGSDADRSPGLGPFKQLFALQGVRFFTLQCGSRDEFLLGAGPAAFDLGHEIDSLTPPFEETAALIMSLDLVITCDTSIGHLAGALGRPVWVVLQFVPDWRWMMEREDSPWYPMTRLFRQTVRGNWAELFDRVTLRLKDVIAGKLPAVWRVDNDRITETSAPCGATSLLAPISIGELLDRITILEIKMLRVEDKEKLGNVTRELSALKSAAASRLVLDAEGIGLLDELRRINTVLWEIKDSVRKCEARSNFGTQFVELARSVNLHNDIRAKLKKQLSDRTESEFVEEKSYVGVGAEWLEQPGDVGANGAHFNLLVGTRYGQMIYNKNDAYVGASLAAYGEWSEAECELFRQLVHVGHVVVEAGANIGAHTVQFAQLVGEHGLVYAYEPQRIIFQTLCGNLALNQCVNVVARQQGLGRKGCTMVLPLADPRIGNNFSGLSLLKDGRGERVDVVTIDSLALARCDLIKADVEGMEEEVITGAANTISKYRPMIYLEDDRLTQSGTLIRLLQSLGYRMWLHLPPLFNADNYAKNSTNIFGSVTSRNLLCQPTESAKPVSGLREVTQADE